MGKNDWRVLPKKVKCSLCGTMVFDDICGRRKDTWRLCKIGIDNSKLVNDEDSKEEELV